MLWHRGWKVKTHTLKLVPNIDTHIILGNNSTEGMEGRALAFPGIDVQRVFALIVIFSWFFLVSSLDYIDSSLLVLWSALCFVVFLDWIWWLIQVLTPAGGKSKWWMGILLMGDDSFKKKKTAQENESPGIVGAFFLNWHFTWCKERVRKNKEESYAWVASGCFVIKLILLSAKICIVLTSTAVTEGEG